MDAIKKETAYGCLPVDEMVQLPLMQVVFL